MSNELTPEVKEKLQKLVRLLSSDKEGEVLAAVSAMDRLLEKAGLDFHTFADFLTEPHFDQARIDLIDAPGTVRLPDGRVTQSPIGPRDPNTGRLRPKAAVKNPWKNWCAQQRFENQQRLLEQRERQKALEPPK
jgi:hypothetical protein